MSFERTVPQVPSRAEILSIRTAWQGFFRIDLVDIAFESYAGGRIHLPGREIFQRGSAVCVLPYDPVRDEVVLIRQFLPGALVAGLPAWPLQAIAGMIDATDTDPVETARREAKEEAGLVLHALERVLTYLPSPGGCSETITLFVARTDTGSAGGIHGLAEEHEDIRVEVLGFEEAMARLDAGEVTPSPALVALLWLSRHRERLRATWI